MKSFFIELFEYTNTYNLKLEEVINGNSSRVSERTIKVFNHMLDAHQIWNNRVNPVDKQFGVWATHPATKWKEIIARNYEQSGYILNNFDLEAEVEYQNSRGDKFTNFVKDMLFQVINHSTYHRGQLASQFREVGLEPLMSEYIFFKRRTG
ncbi:MAG: damage-inducible protein DinB [Chitinophagaceae bacterium]|nr:MAG: damage-inducible protein DinB [Chitinophagaceae bacterium]